MRIAAEPRQKEKPSMSMVRLRRLQADYERCIIM